MNFKKLNLVEHLVIHCSATKPTMNIGKREIDQWHRQRGWLCIGYHLVITRDGSLQFGRPIGKQGAHVKGHNNNSIGICMVGGVDADGEPEDNYTKDQWRTLRFVIDDLKFRYPTAEVVGHYQLDQHKACPSFNPAEKGFK